MGENLDFMLKVSQHYFHFTLQFPIDVHNYVLSAFSSQMLYIVCPRPEHLLVILSCFSFKVKYLKFIWYM